jgi:uncharacterized protein
MASKVYFSKNLNNAQKMFTLINEKGIITKSDKTAIKTHFGEDGNTRFVSPSLIKPITDSLKEINNNVFLTDTNTLYVGNRTNATDHIKQAIEHGFAILDIPIVIADGESGDEEYNVEINAKHFKEVKIGAKLKDVDSMLVISHFKGHVLFGFGGAIKNLGMGFGSRAGKLAMHSKISPSVGNKCIGCGICTKSCLPNAIKLEDGLAIINAELCIGCAKCISICPENAIRIPWGGASSNEAQERCAEYAFGAIKDKRIIYITFINNITKDCDCLSDSEIIGQDVGVIASTDPLAIDKAAYDLVVESHKSKDIFVDSGNPDGTHILDYASKLGLGNLEYDLINIDEK